MMFVEEYNDIIGSLQIGIGEDDYMKYLQAIPLRGLTPDTLHRQKG